MAAASTPALLRYVLGPGASWADAARAVLDCTLVSYLVFRVLLLIRGTRAVNMLVGLFLLGLGYLASQWMNLVTLNWLLGYSLSYSVIFGVIVLFQSDIRRALAHLGRGSRWLVALAPPEERRAQAELVGVVARAAAEMSRTRTGALMVIERVADLDEVVQSGVKLEAAPSAELLLSIFQHASPLHDGAVVLRRGRVAASGCLLPLTATPIVRDLGTRHRAALGLAEEVDALVVVVSEERGEISLAVDGVLSRGLDEGALRKELARLLVPEPAGPVGLLVRLGLRAPPRADDGKPEGGRAAL